MAVPNATVALRGFEGLLGNAETLAQGSTDQDGFYQLTYTYQSICLPLDNTPYWIEASAAGYQDVSSQVTPGSDPKIHCTDEPQVINLSLQPFGVLRLVTHTTGTALDLDDYALAVAASISPDEVTLYPIGANDEQILSRNLPGQYSLELTEVAGNCTVAGENPRAVIVVARDTAVSTFDVSCQSQD